MSENKISVDSGQIIVIKKDLVDKFVRDDFDDSKEEALKKKIETKEDLDLNYSSCCAVTQFKKDNKLQEGAFVFNVRDDGSYYFEVNPEGTEVYEDFIGFTEEATGFNYTYDKKWWSEEEGYYAYVTLSDELGVAKIKEEGEYKICLFTNTSGYE